MPVKPGKRGWAGWNQVDPEGKEPKKGKGKVPTSVFSQNKFDTMERSKSPPQVEPREENLRGQGFSLIIRNLARETRLEQLRSLFEPFGVVIDAYIPRDHRTGRHRGFGFLEFRDQRDADAAISSLNGHQLLGRPIDVCFATQKRKTPAEMRDAQQEYRRSRGGYGGGREEGERGRDGYGGGGGGSGGGGGYGRRDGYDGGRDRDGHRRGRSHSRERERGRYDDRRHSRHHSHHRSRSRSRGRYRDDRGGDRGRGRYKRESPRGDERRGRSPSYEVSDH